MTNENQKVYLIISISNQPIIFGNSLFAFTHEEEAKAFIVFHKLVLKHLIRLDDGDKLKNFLRKFKWEPTIRFRIFIKINEKDEVVFFDQGYIKELLS